MRKKSLYVVKSYNPNTKQLSPTFDSVVDANGNMVPISYYKKGKRYE